MCSADDAERGTAKESNNDVRFDAHSGLESGIAACPKSAKS
jgi:hypothetical protein